MVGFKPVAFVRNRAGLQKIKVRVPHLGGDGGLPPTSSAAGATFCRTPIGPQAPATICRTLEKGRVPPQAEPATFCRIDIVSIVCLGCVSFV